ncbi:MAG: sulfatase-like hydrolase/transferase [Acidimicrobiales bacterium]
MIRREGRELVELLAVWGFAIAQPLLDVFGRAPEQFAFRVAGPATIVAFALVVALAGPLVLWLVEVVAGLVHPRARRVLHLVFLGGLVAAFVVQAARPLADGPVLYALGAAAGAAAVAAYQRVEAVRAWLALAALAPAAFVGLFLLTSPTSRLLDDVDSAGAGDVGNPVPVVILVFDELPLTSVVDADGTIDAELFPNLAGLAAESTWFRNATAVSSSTWHAVPALVTGRLPDADSAPVAADHPDSLFTLLGDGGELNVVESVTRMCPTDVCDDVTVLGAPRGLGELLRDARRVMRARLSPSGDTGDAVAGMVEERPRGEAPSEDGFADFGLDQPTRFRAFTERIVDERPALHYLHVLLPHVPYRYLPSGARYPGPDPDLGRDGDQWTSEPWPVDLGRQRHLLQVGYVDSLLGDVLDTLRERGVYDDAMIVVTSDHGISFRPREPIRGLEGQALADDVLADLAWVPLLVKRPGTTAGTVDDTNVLSIDVLPTIADVLDVDIPWEVDGQSALSDPRTDGHKPFLPSDVNDFGVAIGSELAVEDRAELADVLADGVDRFLGAAGDPLRWFRAGPRPDLVGTEIGAESAVEASFVDVDPVVDRSTGTVPALLRGRVGTGEGVEPGDVLAVAVNGVVGGTSPAMAADDGVSVAVVVSDELFRDGANEISVHRVGAR